jgi:hypothetical protein
VSSPASVSESPVDSVSDLDYLNWELDRVSSEKAELERKIIDIYKVLGRGISWQDFKARFNLDIYVEWEDY